MIGRHDFAAFAATRGEEEPDTVRHLHKVFVRRKGPLLTIRFEGDGFLYKMVRLLTGTLVRVAQGKAPVDLIADLLAHPAKKKAQFTAPADGLYLVKVAYR